MNILKKSFLVSCLIVVFSPISIFALCKPTGVLSIDIIAKADYSAMLPLRIAGVTLAQGHIPDAQGAVGSPICVCNDPFPRIGIPVSFFEPSRLIEVIKDPYCFPTMGLYLPTSPLLKGTKGDGRDRQRTFFQAHYFVFPIYAILELLTDFICMESTGFDLAYITEVDPLWNNDSLSAIINPEALLFANPISNLACIADSISSQINMPLDPMFWCKGSWGNAYPLTGNTTTNNWVEDSASVASSLIYKLHRQLILWGSWGQLGLCGYYPAPIWRKSAYRLQLVTPIPHPIAMGIGQDGRWWTWLKNIPMTASDNFAYLLFKKRECCAL